MNDEYKPPVVKDFADGSKGPELNLPALDVACLSTKARRAALIATTGSHCEVWRGAHKNTEDPDDDSYLEYVVKYPRDEYGDQDVRVLARHHRVLREALGDIVPEALFVVSCINGKQNMFVMARAINVWFNIANPLNREEAIGLLCEYPMARAQLELFLAQARKWREGPNPRVIDLYGLDNLVMDNLRQIRFIDSFYVFFFEDMLHMLGGEPDDDLQDKIDVSLRRLAYLQEILDSSKRHGKCR